VGVTTAGIAASALLTLPLSPQGDAGLWMARKLWAPATLRLCGVSVGVSGDVERLKDGAARVFVANHQGYLDVPACFAALPVSLRVLAKKELFRVPLVGHYLRAFGFPAVDRARRERAVQSFDEAVALLGRGRSVLVFPEGTRSVDGALQPFKKGAFVMAIQAGVEVVPVGLAGSFEAFNRRDNVLQPGPVHVHVGAPLQVVGRTLGDRDALREEAAVAVAQACAEARHMLTSAAHLARGGG
jgi:1-acyl-sn-glycerol-3-phosphate acyltransferase